MNFPELFENVADAVTKCLYLALLPKSNNDHICADDHESINKQFGFLSPYRNAAVNTFLTRANVDGSHNSLFIGGTENITSDPTRISNIISRYLYSVLQSHKVKVTMSPDGGSWSLKTVATCRFESPIFVAQQIVTDPEAIETKSISKFYAKLFLMDQERVTIADSMNEATPETDEVDLLHVTFADLDKLYSSMMKYIAGRDNFSKKPNRAEHFLVRLISAEGLLDQRLVLSEGVKPMENKPQKEDIEKVISDTEAMGFDGSYQTFSEVLRQKVEYRKAGYLKKFPSVAELANVVFGVPIAIAGFNELLLGGLRQGAGEGTVTLLRGGAGCGKTTLGISIQRSFEALGIPTIFVTSEETHQAIVARRNSVLNIAQKNHSAFVQDGAESIILDTIANESNASTSSIFEVVRRMQDKLSKTTPALTGAGQFSRVFIVFDGIHNFLKDNNHNELAKFITTCRGTNTHVLITSSDDWMLDEGMEYLVDNYLHLSSTTIPNPMPHIERKIELVKTRHQSSLIGKHLMQFQDEGDLLFIPNFSEILKSQSHIISKVPDLKTFSQPFSLELAKGNGTPHRNALVDLKHFDRSITLVYGRGTSSKTSFCLRLLCSPNDGEQTYDKKILVVSFLASQKYYHKKAKSFSQKMEPLTGKKSPIEVETIHFTPGMITAEEVYSEISNRIAHFSITQRGYSGLLIDGLHNIFVQFPELENHPELWSAIINLVRRVGIKTVITFTDFEVWGARTLTTVDYENLRAKPLLVALSQSVDYGFALVPSSQVGDEEVSQQGHLFEDKNSSLFRLSAFVAHAQPTPSDWILWDRSKEEIRAR